MNFDQHFIIFRRRVFHLLELKNIWRTIFRADNRFHVCTLFLSYCLTLQSVVYLEHGICTQANTYNVKDALKDVHLPASMPDVGRSEKCHHFDKTNHESQHPESRSFAGDQVFADERPR